MVCFRGTAVQGSPAVAGNIAYPCTGGAELSRAAAYCGGSYC